MGTRKALFISDESEFHSKIEGGVQICSQEYYNLLKSSGFDLVTFYVGVSKKLTYRILRKLNLDAYNLYNPEDYVEELVNIIIDNNIKWIFLNKAELIRFAEVIKLKCGSPVKIIVLSHGNETSDFLHELTRAGDTKGKYKLLIGIIRLGLNLYFESLLRINYIDNVVTMSEVEQNIEKWLGISEPILIPRIINSENVCWTPEKNNIGFIGTLDHVPNLIGLQMVFDELKKRKIDNIKINLIGGKQSTGQYFTTNYTFVRYLGMLSADDALEEMKKWSFVLNPVFWYARGASTKLAKIIGWGIPPVTTIAGTRGYNWKSGNLLTTENTAEDFVDKLLFNLKNPDSAEYWREQTILVSQNSSSIEELGSQFIKQLKLDKEG
jgi:hypothetical protein